jgi:SH3-like domain-containing protein
MNQKHLSLFGALSLSFTLLAGTATQAQAQQHVSIRGSEANMRSGPSTRHDVQWSLGKGFPLQVTGRQGRWLRVKDFENDAGWVHRSVTASTPHMVVKAPVVNLRSRPSTRSRVMGKMEHGEVVRTLEKRTGWAKVQRDNGQKGWASRGLLWGW